VVLSASPQHYRDLIEKLLSRLAYPELGEETLARLVDYVHMTQEWGKKMDLTAARDAAELVDLSIADAAVVAAEELSTGFPEDRIVDVGSGGGAPGIPLLVLLGASRSCALPGCLVEPRQKRVAFLRQAVLKVGLSRTEVRRARSEEQPAQEFEVAIARATLPPPEWLSEGARLARRSVWVLLAKEPPPTLPGFTITAAREYEWPLTRVRRHAVRFQPLRSNEEG
jgi:16S rRNA (guanine527-N7)-methyltransferase